MPLYDFECQNKKCRHVFEDFNSSDNLDAHKNCKKCGKKAKKIVSFRNSQPTFTEKLYAGGGFYHAGIGEVVRSEKHLNQRCAELGLKSKHEGASMNHKQERLLMSKRVHDRPREVIKKPTWSGRGANMPVFESYEKSH